CIFLFLMFSIPPMSTLFPYTTLFRSFKVLILVFYLDGVFQPSLVEIKKRFSSILYTVKTKLQKRKCSRVKSLKMGNNLMPDVISDRKSTRLNSSHVKISYAVFCLKKK